MTRRTTQSGFTLIEVLIATFIIALGSLGLIVLFAGAASQQQRSAQLDQSAFVSRNAEAMMARRFGNVSIAPSTPPDQRPKPDVWQRLSARTITGNPDAGMLSIDPNERGYVYFILEEPSDVVLYKREDRNEDYVPPWSTGTSPEPYPFDTAPPPFNRGLRSASHPRIVADTMAVEVSYGSVDPLTSAFVEAVGSPRTYRVVDEGLNEVVPPPKPADWPDAVAGDFGYGRSGLDTVVFSQGAVISQNYIVFERAMGGDPTCDDCKTNIATRISGFDFSSFITPGSPQLVIDEIRLKGGFKYLGSDVISLEDRVVHVPDADYPAPLPGRPAAAYALLYRVSGDGVSSQLAAFTYSITGGRAGAEYLPDESPDADTDDEPLRQIDAILHYDDTLQQYYIMPENDDDDRWIIEPGQLLLIEGEDETSPGADFAVRILAQRTIDSEVRGYLDRAPRAHGASLLDEDEPQTNITIQAIQPFVTNEDDEGVRWRLQPQEVRVFQL